MQQEFVLEASELEGEELGSPPRASAVLSHPLSKAEPGNPWAGAEPAARGGRDRHDTLTSTSTQHRLWSCCLKPHLKNPLRHRPHSCGGHHGCWKPGCWYNRLCAAATGSPGARGGQPSPQNPSKCHAQGSLSDGNSLN